MGEGGFLMGTGVWGLYREVSGEGEGGRREGEEAVVWREGLGRGGKLVGIFVLVEPRG